MTARATGRPTGRGSGTAEGATVVAMAVAMTAERTAAAHARQQAAGTGHGTAATATDAMIGVAAATGVTETATTDKARHHAALARRLPPPSLRADAPIA